VLLTENAFAADCSSILSVYSISLARLLDPTEYTNQGNLITLQNSGGFDFRFSFTENSANFYAVTVEIAEIVETEILEIIDLCQSSELFDEEPDYDINLLKVTIPIMEDSVSVDLDDPTYCSKTLRVFNEYGDQVNASYNEEILSLK
jgi:hypothetical protein